jgi:hypothetical protein
MHRRNLVPPFRILSSFNANKPIETRRLLLRFCLAVQFPHVSLSHTSGRLSLGVRKEISRPQHHFSGLQSYERTQI